MMCRRIVTTQREPEFAVHSHVNIKLERKLMKVYAATFGAIAGGIIVLYSIILFVIMGDFSQITAKDLQTAETLGYIRYLVLLLGVVMGMLAFRRKTPGVIGYKQMLALGAGVAVVSAVFVGLLEWIYVAMNPTFFDDYGRLALEAMKAKGASAADIAEFHKQQEAFAWLREPAAMGAFYFVETTLVGTAFALVAALFARRKESDVEDVTLSGDVLASVDR